MIAIISDSQAAVQTVRNLSRGQAPRSNIKVRIKQALRKETRDIEILLAIGHIGIKGNEKVDQRAAYESFLGQISGSAGIATEEGVSAMSRPTPSPIVKNQFNPRSAEWNKHALSGYTWARTEG